MASPPPARRSPMLLYTSMTHIDSHRVRFVIAEKDIPVELVTVEPEETAEKLQDLPIQNPEIPIFQERDLVLYSPLIIMEYLDERFPYPPLMPVEPAERAFSRMVLHRMQTEWYNLVPDIKGKSERAASKARKTLKERLAEALPLFAKYEFFLQKDFSLLDCTVVPLLYRLPYWNIELPAAARPILDYAERIFQRPSFKQSLTEEEQDLRGS